MPLGERHVCATPAPEKGKATAGVRSLPARGRRPGPGPGCCAHRYVGAPGPQRGQRRHRVEERRDRYGLLRFLVDHHRHADAAVGMAAARQVAPLRGRSVDEVGPVGERAHERDREPVAHRLADAGLILHVVREVRQRVALRRAALVGDELVAAGERHRLERQEVDLLRVVERELDDAADLLVVHAVDDRRDRNDIDAGGVQVLDRAQLDVEQVADETMRVGGVADAVELQIGVAQAGFGRGLARTQGSWRTRCRWSPPGRCCSRPSSSSAPRRGSTATSSARRPRTAPTSGASA